MTNTNPRSSLAAEIAVFPGVGSGALFVTQDYGSCCYTSRTRGSGAAGNRRA